MMTVTLLKLRRNRIEMSVLLFSLVSAACSLPSTAADGDVKHTSGLDREAAKVAQEAFDLGYKHCGDSYYKLRIDQVGIPDTLSELKGVKLEVIADQLSEADRLNSVEWKGVAVLRYTVTRSHSQASGWGQWLPAHPPGIQGKNRFIKRSGRWEGPFDDPPSMGWLDPHNQPASDIDCGAIPK